jgi:hypothetical protein
MLHAAGERDQARGGDHHKTGEGHGDFMHGGFPFDAISSRTFHCAAVGRAAE